MEKALTKVSSLKAGSFWISKKAKEEFSNITEDITVSTGSVCASLSLVSVDSFAPGVNVTCLK